MLSSLFNHAVRLGHVETNPARGLRKNPRKRSHRFLGAAEIARLERTLAALYRENPNFRQPADIARLLLLTGCRAGEILGLEWDRVDGGVIRLADAKTGPRVVWLGPAARVLIDACREPTGDGCFPTRREVRGGASGIIGASFASGPGSPTSASTTCATPSPATPFRGDAPPVVARLLGHKTLAMTMRYVHADDKEAEAAAAKMGDILDQRLAKNKN